MIKLTLPGVCFEPLTVTNQVHHQDCASCARPKYAHILQFKLRLGCVQAVSNHDAWHAVFRVAWKIEIGGYPESRLCLIDEVLSTVAIAAKFFDDSSLERQTFWKFADGRRQRFLTRVVKALPVTQSLNAVPASLFVLEYLERPIVNVAIQHLGYRHLRALLGCEHARGDKGKTAGWGFRLGSPQL